MPAIRFRALLQRWQTQGRVWLLTSELVDQFSADPSLQLKNIPTLKVPLNDWRSRTQAEQPYRATSSKTAWWYAYAASAYRAFPFILFTGDGGRTYRRNAYRAAYELIENEKITHLFTSYRPWADHLIAYYLKRKFPHLTWIADFRDRASDPVRGDVWWPWLQAQFQRYILRRADIVTAVSEGQAIHFRQYHQRVVILRNGLEEAPSGFLSAPASPHFTITYTGSIYPKLQTADPLLALLRQLLNEDEINPAHLELHYAGKDQVIWKEWLRRHGLYAYGKFHQMLPLAEAKTLQRQSQLNVLLSWSAENYGGIMTAKLASYLEAGRPIVTLLNGPLDPELTAAIEDTQAGFVFPSTEADSPARLRAFLLDAYRTWSFSGALPWRSNPQLLQPYTWDAQVNNFLHELAPTNAPVSSKNW